MEKNLSELLSYFEVPSYVILLVGLALYLIRILNPITLFSSNVVEQRLFSKEQVFSLKVIKHILNTLFWVIVLYPTTFYLRDVILMDLMIFIPMSLYFLVELYGV
nr:hypothetical protein P5626_09655 [Bacillus subtilis]